MPRVILGSAEPVLLPPSSAPRSSASRSKQKRGSSGSSRQKFTKSASVLSTLSPAAQWGVNTAPPPQTPPPIEPAVIRAENATRAKARATQRHEQLKPKVNERVHLVGARKLPGEQMAVVGGTLGVRRARSAEPVARAQSSRSSSSADQLADNALRTLGGSRRRRTATPQSAARSGSGRSSAERPRSRGSASAASACSADRPRSSSTPQRKPSSAGLPAGVPWKSTS